MNVHETIMFRRSVRRYKVDAIDPVVLEKLKTALRLAPSAKNNQPWKFVFIRDENRKKDIAAACGSQLWMSRASVITAGIGFESAAYTFVGGSRSSLDIDIAIAFDHLSLAAAAEGIGSCWIGKFDETAVAKLLNIPDGARVVALMTLGHPESGDAFHLDIAQRKPMNRIIIDEQF